MCKFRASVTVPDLSHRQSAIEHISGLSSKIGDGHEIEITTKKLQVIATVKNPDVSFKNNLDLARWVKDRLGMHPHFHVGASLLPA